MWRMCMVCGHNMYLENPHIGELILCFGCFCLYGEPLSKEELSEFLEAKRGQNDISRI